LRPGARSLDSLLKLRRAPELVDCASSDLPASLPAARDTLESSATPNETSEPTVDAEYITNEADAREIATNEPTLAAGVGLESPTFYEKRRSVKRDVESSVFSRFVFLSRGGFRLCF
jgi:hypothetical protein